MKPRLLITNLAAIAAIGSSPVTAQDKPGGLMPPAAAAPAESASVPANYRLSPGDLIYVKVFQEDDLCSSLRVGEDGTVSFPLIGLVKVGGLTLAQAREAIFTPLDARYVINPQITLTVLSFTDRHVTVLGQVQHAGTYNIKEQGSVDFLEAIGLAGGFTRLANTSQVTVRRVVDGRTTILIVDAKRLANNSGASSFPILPGDTITVQERLF